MEIPHNWKPEAHQIPILKNKARFKVLVWHRKAHKTTLAINELIRWAAAVKGTYWYVAPFYNQAKKIVWQDPEMLPKYVPEEIWKNRNNSELYVPFPNGSILYVMGADKPDSLRGPNPRGVVLDEYGDIKTGVWSGIIQPIMTASPKSWTWFVGTPKGRNDFWNKYQYAKSGDNPQWYSSMLKASDSGIIDAFSLDDAKKTTTQAFFNQEYECEFLEGAGAYFRRIRENLHNEDIQPENHSFRIGVDLAKYQDWTVITPFDLNTFKVGKQERFNQVDWNLQKARIEATALRYNRGIICVDSTGVGDPIAEDLKRAGLTLEPEEGFKFTESSKRQLLDNLAILLEQDKIKIPNDDGLLTELESMRFVLKTTDSGKTRLTVEVPEGMTDDRIMSLALAVWGISNPITNLEQDFGLYNTKYG